MFNAEKFIDEVTETLKKEISGKALIAFSGGVDSTVCAALVNKAIGDRLIAVHVDTGYMRKNESENVKKLMEEIGLNYRFIDASKEYISGKKQNTLSDEHIKKIVRTYKDRKDVEKYAHAASFSEIRENDFNLNIPRYVDTFEEEEEIDIDAVQKEIDTLEKELVEVRLKMKEKLKEIQR